MARQEGLRPEPPQATEGEGFETPGTMTIMVIYLVLFISGYLAMFLYLSGKWPIS